MLVALIAVLGGAVLAAAAGARRTDTAMPRFVAHTNNRGVNMSSVVPGVERLPEVRAMDVLAGEPLLRVLPDGQVDSHFPLPVASVNGRILYRAVGVALRAGRLPRPDRPDEALATIQAAREDHIHVGDRVVLRDMSGILTRQKLFVPSRVAVTAGIPVQFTIVGVGVDYTDVAAASARAQGGQGAFGTIYLTPAYAAAHGGTATALYSGAGLELMPGTDLARLRTEIDALGARIGPSSSNYDFSSLELETAAIQRAIRPDVTALALFALLVGLAGLLLLGQVLARQTWSDAADFPVLRALGVTRSQFVLAASLFSALVAVAGGVLAAVIAVLSSPLTPVGPARVAEPHLGIAVNVAVLGLGLAVVVSGLSAQVALAAWQATSPARTDTSSVPRWSRVAEAARRAGMTAPATTGLGLALEPGRGASAIPLRSTLTGTTLAIAALVMAVTFNGDMARLNGTPARYGWSWDLAVDGGYVPLPAVPVSTALARVPAVAAWAGGNYGSVIAAGQLIPAVGLDQVRGSVFPSLLAGHPPDNAGEIVFGQSTLRSIGGHLGSSVAVQVGNGRQRLQIAGTAVFPDFERGGFAATDLGVGAATTVALIHPAGIPPGATYSFLLVRFRPGTNPTIGARDVQQALGPVCAHGTCSLFADRKPNEVNSYRQVSWTPLMLAAILGLLGVLALGHALISLVGRRRRDLAILKTLGFTRGQLGAVVAWQSTALVVIAFAVGLPLGAVGGRWLWHVFANQLGVASDSLLPVVAIVSAAPIGLVVGNLVASVPAWRASRIQPGRVLRAE